MSNLVDGSPYIQGATNDTLIGNVGDRLKVDISESIDPGSSLQVTQIKVITAGITDYYTQAVGANLVLKELSVGGRVACETTVATYVAATTQQLPGGGFNSSGDVALWTNTSIGDSALTGWSYDTGQFTEGTGSATKSFPKSDSNNYVELTYTWGSAQNLSAWRYINSQVRVSVAAGGTQTRTVQLRLTSGTAVRIWQITGTTTTSPFNVEQWLPIVADIKNPEALAGAGTFDVNSVNSISLRLFDSRNKTGQIWWDDIKFSGAITMIDKIYSGDGTTIFKKFNPVVSVTSGQTILLMTRNNSATTAEIQAETIGVYT